MSEHDEPPRDPPDDDRIWPAIAIGAAALGAAAAFFGGPVVKRAVGAVPDEPLSRLRHRILQICAEVLPCSYKDPDPRKAELFKRIDPSYEPESAEWRERIRAAGADPDKYTDCGAFPGYVADLIGAKGGLEKRGTYAVMLAGQAHGAWIAAGEGRRPKPGDFLVIGTKSGEVSHVDIAISTKGRLWRTADTGQRTPDGRMAGDFVERDYDERAGTLSGPKGSNAAPRFLLGWVDIDRYPIGMVAA